MEDEHSSGARVRRVGPSATSQWPLACPRHKACSATWSPLYITYLDTAVGGALRVVLRGRPFFFLFLNLHGNKVDVLREPLSCSVVLPFLYLLWCLRRATTPEGSRGSVREPRISLRLFLPGVLQTKTSNIEGLLNSVVSQKGLWDIIVVFITRGFERNENETKIVCCPVPELFRKHPSKTKEIKTLISFCLHSSTKRDAAAHICV